MSLNSEITKETLFEKVISHAFISAKKNNRSISGYIGDHGFRIYTFNNLCRQRIPNRQKFSLFLTLLVDYLNTNQINIALYEKRNR